MLKNQINVKYIHKNVLTYVTCSVAEKFIVHIGIFRLMLWMCLPRNPGVNPTKESYYASAAKNHVMSCLVRFENKNVFFCFEKLSSLLCTMLPFVSSCTFRSRRIGS
jgi:hypothetical protein